MGFQHLDGIRPIGDTASLGLERQTELDDFAWPDGRADRVEASLPIVSAAVTAAFSG